jgi:hypothetical protein
MIQSETHKVIFLDIDGVLNVDFPEHDKYGRLFHPHFENNLRKIVNETGAKIVISSSWRSNGLLTMREMWKDRNLPGEVVGITKYLGGDKNLPFYERLERGNEIQEYLNSHPIIVNYVIIDDDGDMLLSQLSNFVQTSENSDHPDCIDIGYGLTDICTDKAIQILNSK